MSSKQIVVMVDRDPSSVRSLLANGDSSDLPFSLLVVRFELHFPTLVRSIMNHQPSCIVLGSGFGMEPNIGEDFLSELEAAGFNGCTVVCCRDTYMVLPLLDGVKRVSPEKFSKSALCELLGS